MSDTKAVELIDVTLRNFSTGPGLFNPDTRVWFLADGTVTDEYQHVHKHPTDPVVKLEGMITYRREQYRRIEEDFKKIRAAVTGTSDPVPAALLHHATELSAIGPIEALQLLASKAKDVRAILTTLENVLPLAQRLYPDGEAAHLADGRRRAAEAKAYGMALAMNEDSRLRDAAQAIEFPAM